MKLTFARFTHHVSRCLFILFIVAILLIPHASAQVVEIPDPNLRQAIRETLQLPDGVPITEQDMLRLTGFAAEEAGIENITGLEYAHNLRSLFLRNNPIEDLTPLANLTQLRLLHLAGVPLADLTFLKNLTELRELYLGDCRITDITPLQNLTKLVLLDLSVNRIVDVGPLANLTALTDLRIESNQIVDVSPLANLTQLTNLTLANNAITDFRPLFGLNLQRVDIDIHKADELASSEIEIPDPNLRQAVREALALPDEVPITQLEMLGLRGFAAEDVGIENITGLEYAHNLRSLFLRSNPIEDFTPLANLTQLRLLHLAGVPLADLTFLKNLTELRELYLGGCRITDITPIQNLTKLVLLDLSVNRIMDVGPLANLALLRTLWIDRNRITDFSPLEGLSLTDFSYDQICLIPGLPIQDRIDNRSLPSVILPWDDGILNRGGNWWDDSISYLDRVAYHDLWWHYTPFEHSFLLTSQGYQLAGNLQSAIARREELLSKNPNMLFLVDLRQSYAARGRFPEDWFGWLRDENGNLIPQKPGSMQYLIDFRLAAVQDIVVQRAIAVSKCGVYDGIMFDAWAETHTVLPNSTLQEEQSALISILRRIRQGVPDDFLILCNRNETKLPLSAPYINGGFMETFPLERGRLHGYTRKDIIVIETNLIWYETNVREPKINVLRGFGVGAEPPDSPRNKQWMRLFTTMSLTLSDGYVLYTLGTIGGQKQYQKHIWHPFWDANLGQPISHTAQRYQEDIEGLYIREFTNGWAVYNRSGTAQEISLTEEAMGVSSNQTGRTHQLADLDGEIYLKTVAEQPTSPYDLNMDGVVNVLDLILTAQRFGSTEGDINGDGITNILDLILVAQHLGETSAPAAPAALPTSLSPETVQKWIDMAYAQNDGSVIFAQGIAMLERLLALTIPDKTVLRANYPNPFNPETWIPYHLASNTEVRISIYDIQGALVRQFNLGYKKAGYYTNRTKAAHWDGRNEIGEPVSSGIYFYTLTTDDYTGTRRMVILK